MKNKIKILECIRQGNVGGGETHVFDLVRKMDKTNFEVQVLAFTSGPLIDNLNKIGIKTHVVSSKKAFDLFVWRKVMNILKEEKIDIIHAHGTRAATNIVFPSKLLKIPYLYTVHGWSFHDGQSIVIKKVRQFCEKYLSQFAVKNITVSESNNMLGKKLFGLKKSNVIYNGIDIDKFHASSCTRDKMREQLNISKDDFLIGYMVRLTYQKAPMTMLKAFDLAYQTNTKLRLLIIGNGEQEEDCKRFVKEKGLDSVVKILDFTNQMSCYLNAIDLYCLPSLWEGMPIGLMEAMAVGKPCIATPVDGTKELIQNDLNGLFVEKNNHIDLAEKINKLSNDIIQQKTLGINAAKWIKKKFNLNKTVDEIEESYYTSLKLNLKQ